MQHQLMTIDEKLAISNRACSLLDSGDRDGYYNLMKTTPLPPYIAKVIKEKVGLDYLTNSGWNLAEVEAEFGPNWINQ